MPFDGLIKYSKLSLQLLSFEFKINSCIYVVTVKRYLTKKNQNAFNNFYQMFPKSEHMKCEFNSCESLPPF